MSEALQINIILEYSGFDNSVQQTIITADGFESYDNTLTLGESYIINLAKGFSNRTFATGKTIFGLFRTNILKATIHWDQDFRRISRTPSLVSISNVAKFCTVVKAERQRARIRKYRLEESDILSKSSDPGKLKQHKDWIPWFRALKNYLSTILGKDRVPLRYAIIESEAPDYTIKLQPNYNFNNFLINCMPLTRLTYKIYPSKVHQLIHALVQGETRRDVDQAQGKEARRQTILPIPTGSLWGQM